MGDRVIIQNERLRAEIDLFGAELKSLEKDGIEQLWNGDPTVWAGTSPVLFPICGGLLDDTYIYDGKTYQIPKHGFARQTKFTVSQQGTDFALLRMDSTPQTLACYPFAFSFFVHFQLKDNMLSVTYTTKNLSDKEMFYSVGAHEAYSCPEGIENYTVEFSDIENFDASVVDGTVLRHEKVSIAKNTNKLPLKNKYFQIDALVFTNLKSRTAVLSNNTTGKKISLDFHGADYFLLWTKPGAKYICMEPWQGIPDFTDSDKILAHKIGIQKLSPHAENQWTHTITFL